MKKSLCLWLILLTAILCTAVTFSVTVLVFYQKPEVPAASSSGVTTTTEAVLTEPESTWFDAERIEDMIESFQKQGVKPIEGDMTDFIIESILLKTGDVYSGYMDADEYTEYVDSYSGEYVGIGVTVRLGDDHKITVNQVIPASPAEEVGICPGDKIVAVEDTRFSFDEADTDALDRVGDMIRGEAGTTVHVTVERDGDERVLAIERRAVINPTVWPQMLTYNGQKVMYVLLTGFDYTTPKAFMEAVDRAEREEADMILFDVRNNPGGLLSVVSTVLTYLVEDQALLCSTNYQKIESVIKAGGYKNKDDTSEIPQLTVSEAGAISYNQAYADHTLKLPCAVLTNGGSASAAELFTSVLRDYKLATIVGENTYGKGCMQSTYTLDSGYALKLTIAYYTPPCGINYDKTTDGPVGIAPDIEVIFTDEENKINLYTADHTKDRQFVAAFNQLSTGEKLPMPPMTE